MIGRKVTHDVLVDPTPGGHHNGLRPHEFGLTILDVLHKNRACCPGRTLVPSVDPWRSGAEPHGSALYIQSRRVKATRQRCFQWRSTAQHIGENSEEHASIDAAVAAREGDNAGIHKTILCRAGN